MGAVPSTTSDSISVLHVDDDPDFADIVSTFLEDEADPIEVLTVTSAEDGLDLLAETEVDCIVSDYDMPAIDGLDFLRLIRDDYPDLPFILFTGRGNEEIASEAISAGVTDYVQKEIGTDQYTVLANRIENAVSQYRAVRTIEETHERFRKLIQHSTDVISIVDAEGRWQYLTPSAKRVLGHEAEELIGENGFDYVHPEDRPEAMEKFAHTIENPDRIPRIEFRFDHPDGWLWLENHARNMVDDPVIGGFVVHTRDVTDRTRREQELARQNERLEEIMSTMSHDLKNPLKVAKGYLELAREREDEAHFDRVEDAHQRIEQIIDDLVDLAREGERITDVQPIEFETIVEDAWSTVETHNSTLTCETSRLIMADRSRLRRLLENLFSNAVDHGGTGVNVRVGTIEDGFYVGDDGPGIEGESKNRVFESGYSTANDGTGFGLSIVKQIAAAHGWEITLTDRETGGARFEITGCKFR